MSNMNTVNIEETELFNRQPTMDEVLAERLKYNLTQGDAAQVVGSNSYRTWQDWERGERNMPLAKWQLFLIKTQHMKPVQYY